MNDVPVFDTKPVIVTEDEPFSIGRLLIGLALLLPGAFLYLAIQLLPALRTIATSQTDSNLLRESSFVGMENYSHLFSDPVYGQAVGYTVVILFVRLVIVAIVPLLIGAVVGGQPFAGRATNRVLLSALAVLISPIALAVLFASFLSPIWGTTPSPLQSGPFGLVLGSPNGARTSVLLVDSMVTVSIAAVLGGAAFMAVMRGRGVSPSSSRAGIGLWVLGLVLVAASAPQTFTIPYVLTGGGPANSTQTIALFLYRTAFTTFNFGYAAAQAVMMIIPAAILGLMAGIVVWAFRLRISFTRSAPPVEASGMLNFLSIPLILVIGLPSMVLFFWGLWLTASTGGFARLEETISVGRTLMNTITAPWFAIWLFQLPLTYLIGLALGFVRPVNQIVSNVIFVGFMALGFIPMEALALDWFSTIREVGALNSTSALGYAFLVNVFSLLAFKMFFDGAYERYRGARNAGQTPTDAFLNTTLLPSLGIVLLVGAVLSFVSAQSLLWPLIATNEPELYGFPTQMLMMRGRFGADPLSVGLAVVFIGVMGMIFLPVFALLNTLVADRLAILAGPATEGDVTRPKPSVGQETQGVGF